MDLENIRTCLIFRFNPFYRGLGAFCLLWAVSFDMIV